MRSIKITAQVLFVQFLWPFAKRFWILLNLSESYLNFSWLFGLKTVRDEQIQQNPSRLSFWAIIPCSQYANINLNTSPNPIARPKPNPLD